MEGVTVIFWAKIDKSAVSKNPQLPKYVFSSGGADKRSRGFSLFHEKGVFVLRAVAAQKKWRLTIENGNIPFNSWFSFAFTWKAGMYFSLTTGRCLFICSFVCFLRCPEEFRKAAVYTQVYKESSGMIEIRKIQNFMEGNVNWKRLEKFDSKALAKRTGK